MAKPPSGTVESASMATTNIDEVCAVLKENASQVDADAAWPEASIRALANAGLLAPGGMREFTETTRRLAQACASTAMIYLMHVCAMQAIAAASSKNLAEKV